MSAVLDVEGKVTEQYRYDAFGAPKITNAAGTVLGQTGINNRFLFTGREWVQNYGFYENRARAYNPKLGRFMSEDPLGFAGGDTNLFRYCGGDPVNKTDPTGLQVPFYNGPQDNAGYFALAITQGTQGLNWVGSVNSGISVYNAFVPINNSPSAQAFYGTGALIGGTYSGANTITASGVVFPESPAAGYILLGIGSYQISQALQNFNLGWQGQLFLLNQINSVDPNSLIAPYLRAYFYVPPPPAETKEKNDNPGSTGSSSGGGGGEGSSSGNNFSGQPSSQGVPTVGLYLQTTFGSAQYQQFVSQFPNAMVVSGYTNNPSGGVSASTFGGGSIQPTKKKH